jgi:signal transduction histidine kinase
MARKISAIILEDSPADAELITFVINENFNSKLIILDDLDEFKNELSRNKYDLIISDFNLNQFGGLDALVAARAINKEIPFILVTGGINDKVAIDALKMGATDYVLKNNLNKLPFTIERVMTEQEEYLRRKSVEIQREELLLQLTMKSDKLQALYNLSSITTQKSQLAVQELQQLGELIIHGFENPAEIGIKISCEDKEWCSTDVNIYSNNGIREIYNSNELSLVIEVFSRNESNKTGSFSEGEVSFLKSVIEVVSNKIELQRSQDLLIRTIRETEEKERKRIASEIHDNLQQMLVVVNQNLNILSKKISLDAENTSKPLEISKQYIMSAIKESRRIAHNLAPHYSGDISTMIRELLNSFSDLPDISFQFESEVEEPYQNQNIDINLFRITQECINNIIKHANASNVTIKITGAFNLLSLSILDDGEGFDRNKIFEKDGHYGFDNMASRVNSIGGSLNIDSRVGIGTHIKVNIPIR